MEHLQLNFNDMSQAILLVILTIAVYFFGDLIIFIKSRFEKEDKKYKPKIKHKVQDALNIKHKAYVPSKDEGRLLDGDEQESEYD